MGRSSIFLILLFIILTYSCSSNTGTNSGDSNSQSIELLQGDIAGCSINDFFAEFVRWVDIIPLDENESSLVNTTADFYSCRGNFYIVNNMGEHGDKGVRNQMMMFDSLGNFVRNIGPLYKAVQDRGYFSFQIYNDTIYIFRSPGVTIDRYTLFGNKIDSQFIPHEKSFQKGAVCKDCYLIFQDFFDRTNRGIARDRLALLNRAGIQKQGVLPLATKAVSWGYNWAPNIVFAGSNHNLTITQHYTDTIFSYSSQQKVYPKYIIDFGAEYVKHMKEYINKAEGDMDFDFSNYKNIGENIYIKNFYESDDYIFIKVDDIIYSKRDDGVSDSADHVIVGIKNKKTGVIKWTKALDTLANEDKNFLFESYGFKQLEGKILYLLITPDRLKSLEDSVGDFIKNTECIPVASARKNRIILKINLK